MSLSSSYGAFRAEIDVLDSALDSPAGIRLTFPTQSAAMTYRHRLNHARKLDRDRNRIGVAPDHPTYGTSRFDPLTSKLRQISGQWCLEVAPVLAPKIEPITDEEPTLCLPLIPSSPPNSGTPPSGTSTVSGSPLRRRTFPT